MPNQEGPDSASAARAARLREQIKGIQGGSAETAPAADKPQPTPALSPREFVEKRMRELDSKP